ncbi:MAG: c-type cytochrome [Pseudomonadota bacterium]|nr:c-type cytochrome [Pseudomonadota bacterium]
MKKLCAGIAAFLSCAMLPTAALAAADAHGEQSTQPATEINLLADGDVEAGQAKAAPCAACHGPDGNGVAPQWPKLAGQHADYLFAQLQAFKAGTRNNPVMMGMAAPLSEQDMRDLAAYYASQEVRGGSADESLVELGERIWRGGNAETGVSACAGCHGPAGRGNGPAQYPHLAGQYAQYVQDQLQKYRNGERGEGTRGAMMQDVASRLSEEEARAVASFIEGLH